MILRHVVTSRVELVDEEPTTIAAAMDAAATADVHLARSIPVGDGASYATPVVEDVDLLDADVDEVLGLTAGERDWLHVSLARLGDAYADTPAAAILAKLRAQTDVDTDPVA